MKIILEILVRTGRDRKKKKNRGLLQEFSKISTILLGYLDYVTEREKMQLDLRKIASFFLVEK